MKRVLFVCMGNICRSPAAEGVFAHCVHESGAGNLIEVDSAGTTSYHQGERADKRMRSAAAKRGYNLDSRSRGVIQQDFERFDVIVAMDRDNFTDLARFGGRANLVLFSDFLDDTWPPEVPDPYYGGETGFEIVLDMLEAGCGPLLKSML